MTAMRWLPTPIVRCCLLVVALLGLAACAGTSYRVSGLDLPIPVADQCVQLLDTRVEVWSIFDGVALPDPVASDALNGLAVELLQRTFAHRFDRDIHTTLPPAIDQIRLREYLALIDLLADQSLQLSDSSDPRWQHRRGVTNLSVGPGLGVLLADTGCSQALVLTGVQLAPQQSLPGLPANRPVLTLGIVALSSGQLVQIQRLVLTAGQELRQPERLQAALARLIGAWPG